MSYLNLMGSIYRKYRVGESMGKKHVSARIKNRIKQQFVRSISILEKKFSHGPEKSSFRKKK